jgi:hypothetical protein
MRPKLTNLVFPLVLAFAVEGHAQAQDFPSIIHVFPSFVDGTTSGNRSYVSTLQISATDFSFPTWCSLGLLSMPLTVLADARGRRETNTIFNFFLAPNGWQILQSQGAQAFRPGSAILQCDRAVTAHLIYTLTTEGAISSEATVSGAAPGKVLQILVDQRHESRAGLAIMNPFSTIGLYRVSIFDIDGRLVSTNLVQIPPGQTFTRFLDEFVAVPRDYRGPVVIETINGVDVYAAGLRYKGDVFTNIPATVRVR